MSVAYEAKSPWSHRGPWTADDVLALPEDDIRYEVVDGALIVNPPPSPLYQDASFLLHVILRTAARTAKAPVRVWEAVGIRLASGQMLVPDVVVGASRVANTVGTLLQPRDVLLVVEIVSPGSTVRDRTEKPVLYAEAGIRHFWRVEFGRVRKGTEQPPVVFAYELSADGEYKQIAECGAGRSLRLEDPFEVEFDPASLVEQ